MKMTLKDRTTHNYWPGFKQRSELVLLVTISVLISKDKGRDLPKITEMCAVWSGRPETERHQTNKTMNM